MDTEKMRELWKAEEEIALEVPFNERLCQRQDTSLLLGCRKAVINTYRTPRPCSSVFFHATKESAHLKY